MRIALISVALIAGWTAVDLRGQSQTPPSGQAAPAFEVASIKPNKSGPQGVQRVSMPAGDRATLTNVTLRTLIQISYPGMSDITGGPDWIGSAGPSYDADRFDVNAKADAPATREELQVMLRTLLVDRFKLVVHTTTTSVPAYALVLARADGRLGPNLHPATADCAALRAQSPQMTGPRDPCGMPSLFNATVNGSVSVHGQSIQTLADMIGRDARRKVVDQTGLTGNFDFELKWTPQVFLQTSFDRGRFPSIDPTGPSIFIAVQDQLGLKLESQKGEDTVVVIDHVEHPTPD